MRTFLESKKTKLFTNTLKIGKLKKKKKSLNARAKKWFDESLYSDLNFGYIIILSISLDF